MIRRSTVTSSNNFYESLDLWHSYLPLLVNFIVDWFVYPPKFEFITKISNLSGKYIDVRISCQFWNRIPFNPKWIPNEVLWCYGPLFDIPKESAILLWAKKFDIRSIDSNNPNPISNKFLGTYFFQTV